MAINGVDGRYGLDCWETKGSDAVGAPEYSDDINELRERARALIRKGHFRYIELSEYNYQTDDWDKLEEFEPED